MQRDGGKAGLFMRRVFESLVPAFAYENANVFVDREAC